MIAICADDLSRNLPNKGDEFLDLLNHPLVDAIVPWFLGDGFHVHSMSANIARKGSSGIYMHRDQMGLTPETIDHAYLLNAMWYLEDVTAERGATRLYPGSHDKNVAPLANMLDVVREQSFAWSFVQLAWKGFSPA